MNIKTKGLFLFSALALFVSFSVVAAGAQVYKWKDKAGTLNYSDNPDISREIPNAEQIAVKQKQLMFSEFGEEQPVEAPQASISSEAQKQQDLTSKGVEVSSFELSPSVGGRAVIVAQVKNNMPYPAAGLRMDVILYLNDRQKLPDIEIPYTQGKLRPDWLGPGESAELLYTTDVSPDDIAGYNYQVVFASIAPTKEKDGSDIREVVVNKKTGESKEVPRQEKKAETEAL